MSFPEENRLWSEVHSLLEALQNDAGDGKSQFLTGMYTDSLENLMRILIFC